MPIPLAAARLLLFPVEELGALVERFLHEAARDVRLLVARRHARTELRLAGRRVDLADLAPDRCRADCAALVSIGSKRPLPCMPPGARCETFGGVLVSTFIDAPPHGRRLIAERDRAAGRRGIALRIVRTVVADREAVDREDLAVLAKPILTRACTPGRARPM